MIRTIFPDRKYGDDMMLLGVEFGEGRLRAIWSTKAVSPPAKGLKNQTAA